jgi:hypothetical protein
MPLPKDEADALRHCAAIHSEQHSPRERQIMAVNVAQRISGANSSHLCFRFKQVATLFYPKSAERAAAFLTQMEEANSRGELVTQIPASEKGLFIDDLIVWKDCPPVPFDSPLRYWFPVTAHERGKEQERTQAAPIMDEGSFPGRLPGNAIGRLAAKIAWQIECRTNHKASAKDVMASLQEMADSGEEADILRRADKEHKAVIWLTSKYEEKSFSQEACQKVLKSWNRSRDARE